MGPVKSIPFTTPDGVERALRFTLGAQERIAEFQRQNGRPAPDSFVVWAMLWTKNEKNEAVPPDISAEWLAENITPLDMQDFRAALTEALTGHAVEKKVIAAAQKQVEARAERYSGLVFGASPESISGSPIANSGGSPRESSKPSLNGTPSESSPSTSDPE